MSLLDQADPDDLQAIARNGIDPRELQKPMQAMFSGGVDKFVKIKGAMKFLHERTDKREDAELLSKGIPAERVEEMRLETNAPKNAFAQLPFWQRLTGLTPAKLHDMDPVERRKSLTRLFNAARLLFQHELALNECGGSINDRGSPDASCARCGVADENTAAPAPSAIETDLDSIDLEAPAPRTFLWDPIREVCHFLHIAKAPLSRLLKELTGMSAIELVDSLKAKNLKTKMRTVLFPALRKLVVARPIEEGPGAKTQVDPRMTLWKRLKDSRRNPDFQRAIYAINLRFASHQRMYRACILAHHKTPSQLEWELLDEFLRELETQLNHPGTKRSRKKKEGEAARQCASESRSSLAKNTAASPHKSEPRASASGFNPRVLLA